MAGYVTILGIVNYISDKVFLFEKQGGCQENMQVMRKKLKMKGKDIKIFFSKLGL